MAANGRLNAMLAADVAGYSSLIEADKEGTLERLAEHRRQLVDPKVGEHLGRVVKTTDTGLLAEFASPTEAVRCAVELQRGMIDRNIGTARGRRIAFRIGLDAGPAKANGDDLVIRAVAALPVDRLATLVKPGGAIDADPAAIAARIAAAAEPSGICISGSVRDAVADELSYRFEDIGNQYLDSGALVRCYAMSADAVASLPRIAASRVAASPPMKLRRGAVAASVLAMAGIWGVAFWAWIGAGSSTAPIPAPTTPGSQTSSVATTAGRGAVVSSTAPDRGGQAPAAPQDRPVGTASPADGGIGAAPESQPRPVSSTVAGGAEQAPSVQPPLPEIAAAAVGINQAQPARPTPPDSGASIVRGNQGAPEGQTSPDGVTTVVRGTRAPPPPQTQPDNGIAVVRGSRAPSARQLTPDSGTDVVRGTRAPL